MEPRSEPDTPYERAWRPAFKPILDALDAKAGSAVIAGGTGSGKTFLAHYLVASLLRQGSRIVVLDEAWSYDQMPGFPAPTRRLLEADPLDLERHRNPAFLVIRPASAACRVPSVSDRADVCRVLGRWPSGYREAASRDARACLVVDDATPFRDTAGPALTDALKAWHAKGGLFIVLAQETASVVVEAASELADVRVCLAHPSWSREATGFLRRPYADLGVLRKLRPRGEAYVASVPFTGFLKAA